MPEIPDFSRRTPPERFDLPRYEPSPEHHGALGAPVRPPNDRSERTAVAALVCALIPSIISNLVAIGLAISVLNKPYGGRFNGRGMAIAALVVAPIWIVLTIVVLVLVSSLEPERGKDGQVTDTSRTGVLYLAVGDCLNHDPIAEGEVEEFVSTETTPCDEPHNAEIVHEFDLPDGDYPGEESIWTTADLRCSETAASVVDPALDPATLSVVYFYPRRADWAANRTVHCLVFSSVDLTRSVRVP